MSVTNIANSGSPTSSKVARDFLAIAESKKLDFGEFTPAEAVRRIQDISTIDIDEDSRHVLIDAIKPLIPPQHSQLPLERTHQRDTALLGDMDERDLFGGVSELLEIPYLQPYDSNNPSEFLFHNWTEGAHGILYSRCDRSMVSLPVKAIRKSGLNTVLNIHFITDTGGPNTEMSHTCFLRLFGVKAGDVVPEEGFFEICGIRHPVRQCDPIGNHADIPLLGVDYFRKIKAQLTSDYDTERVQITSKIV